MFSEILLSSVFQFGMDIATSLSIVGAATMYVIDKRRDKRRDTNKAYLEIIANDLENFSSIYHKMNDWMAEYRKIQKLASLGISKQVELMNEQFSMYHLMAEIQKYYRLIGINLSNINDIGNKLKNKPKFKSINLISNSIVEFEKKLKNNYECIIELANHTNQNTKEWHDNFGQSVDSYISAINNIYVTLHIKYLKIVENL